MIITIKKPYVDKIVNFLNKYSLSIIILVLSAISVYSFYFYYQNGLGLAYNDARSHLDIARRVVEGLKPGIAQLGSVWLPLMHIFMAFTVWNDFMWHSGLSGALISMISFVVTGALIYKYLKELDIPLFGRYVGVFVFVANINVLYLQSTAMTELLLLATMSLCTYELMLWFKNDNILHLIKSTFYVMLATATRYDGWFLLLWVASLAGIKLLFAGNEESPKIKNIIKRFIYLVKTNYAKTEGIIIMLFTMGAFGIFLWLLWNLIIFHDPLFFMFGPYSAKAQQDVLDKSGVLMTKGNLWLSVKFYFYALVFNTGLYQTIVGFIGAIALWFNKELSGNIRFSTSALLAPLFFNIIALFMGHSVLYIQGLSGDTWFNVRYGVMLVPSFAIFIGYLFAKSTKLKYVILSLLLLVVIFQFTSQDAVTIDDARVGSSQKNVSEVSGWLKEHAANEKGFVLISAASHDAIIFSSGMPMSRFIHEGTGLYWESATTLPDRWARWIIMRTYDDNDSTWKAVSQTNGFARYKLVDHFPFADIYEIAPEYLDQLNYEPTIKNQK